MGNTTGGIDLGGVNDTSVDAVVNIVHNQTLEGEVGDRGVDDRATWVVVEHPVGVTDGAAIRIGGVNDTAVRGTREGHAGGDVFELEGQGAVAATVGVDATGFKFDVVACFRGDLTHSTGVRACAEVVREITGATVVAVEVDAERHQEVVTCGGEDLLGPLTISRGVGVGHQLAEVVAESRIRHVIRNDGQEHVGFGCEGQVDRTTSVGEEEPVQVTGVDWVCWISCVGGGEEVAADRLAIADKARSAGGTKARVIDIAFATFTLVDGTCRAGERAEECGVRRGCDWKQIA